MYSTPQPPPPPSSSSSPSSSMHYRSNNMNNGHNIYHNSTNNFVTPPHSSHSRYGYNDIDPLSSSVPPSNQHSYSSAHHQASSSTSIDKEWERLEVEKKRLELQRQRLALEKEELKADRKRFKKVVKANNNRLLPVDEREAATSRQMVIELEQQVEYLQQQLKEQQQQQQQQQQQNPTTISTNTRNDNRKDLEQELQSCRADLQKTQTSLAALFVERDAIRTDKERVEERLKDVEAQLVEQDESTKTAANGVTDDGNEEQMEELDQLRLKVISLEANLQSMKTAYAKLTETHTEEKRQWKESQQQHQHQQRITSSPSMLEEITRLKGLLKKCEDENEALRRTNTELQSTVPSSTATTEEELKFTQQDREELEYQWNDERQDLQRQIEALQLQVRDQTKQIDDWKLLLPRNKTLLEQTQEKNDQLTSQLETARTIETEQSQLIGNLQTELQELREKDGRLQHYPAQQTATASNENNTMVNDDDDDDVVSADDSVCMEDVDLTTKTLPSESSGPLPIVIPSDLTSSELAAWNLEKKYVIEWEWEPRRHRKNREDDEEEYGNRILGGIYTGWLNLEGNPEGYGTLRIVDGSIYTGSWRNGRKNGFGVYTSIDGALFSGPWLDDTYHGRGVYVSELNQVYTGDWKQGKRDGSGIETWEDGARYVGHYKEDGRSGYGSYVYPDGRRFEGNFLDDRPDRHRTQSIKSDGSWSKGDFVGS